jgi:hypothetical protein
MYAKPTRQLGRSFDLDAFLVDSRFLFESAAGGSLLLLATLAATGAFSDAPVPVSVFFEVYAITQVTAIGALVLLLVSGTFAVAAHYAEQRVMRRHEAACEQTRASAAALLEEIAGMQAQLPAPEARLRLTAPIACARCGHDLMLPSPEYTT